MPARSGPRSVPDPEPESDRGSERGSDAATAEGLDRGVEHLQVAAHEMIAAARSFLDVVEDVVSDREKLRGVTGALTDVLVSAGGSLARMADRVAGGADGATSDPGATDDAGSVRRIRRIPVD